MGVRVLLDTTYAHRARYSGTTVYLTQLIEALAQISGVEVVSRNNARRRLPAGGGLGSVRNLLADQRWTEIELPKLARKARADLIHHPLPTIAHTARMPQVVTVHDLAFDRLPGHFDRRFRAYARHAHRDAARRASAVICVSETTAGDVRGLWGVSPERVVVAPHGPGQAVSPRTDRAASHFLYVGDAEPRKNLATLLAAYALYRRRTDAPLELVLAGTAAASEPGIRLEPSPTSDRLAELYAEAAALVHPSLYEGFGFTPLEAMTAGTPVIAARSPGTVEVCGDAARYVDPSDPAAFAAAMAELAATPAVRRELRERGRRRAAEFTWAASARAHVAAYSLALSA
jgi:glycosyltransferase involved in cell wall biosynthesis